MNYSFKNLHPEGKPLIIAVFDEPAYDVLNAFLLAEGRNYGRTLLSFLAWGSEKTFTGNAFTLTRHEKQVTLTKLTGIQEQLTIDRRALRKLLKDYLKAIKKASD